MAHYRVPDYLVCLGGGGTDVGTTFLQQDWILEEVLRENPWEADDAPDQGEASLTAYFVDTDDDSLPIYLSDEDKGNEALLDEEINALQNEYANDIQPGAENRIDIELINIADGPVAGQLNRDVVTSPGTIGPMMTELGLNAWWLEDDRKSQILKPLGGLKGGGVDRKRGLTKAIYRIGQGLADDPLSELEDVDPDSNVAVVVGLGGGTGSGLLLDVVDRLPDGATVTLFGILPGPSVTDDGVEVLSNAYAALSELEYLTLTGQNLFKNILLLPFDPAENLDYFDKAATYTITAYYNIQNDQTNTYGNLDENEDEGPPRYAPFTLASTRYIHYLRSEIDTTEKNFEDYIENNEDALYAEEDLYDALEKYIEKNHPDAASELYTTDKQSSKQLPGEKALDLKSRLDDIYRLLQKEFLNDLEFDSSNDLSEAFEEYEQTAEEKAEWDDERAKEAAIAREFIDETDQFENTEQFYPNTLAANEEEFVNQISREMELVRRKAGIIRATEAIREGVDSDEVIDWSDALEPSAVGQTVAEDIRSAIDPGSKFDSASVEEIASEYETWIDDRDTSIEALETLVDLGETHVDKLKEKWKSEVDVRDPIEDYYSLHQERTEIEDLLGDLEKEVKRRTSLDSYDQPDNVPTSGTNFEQYDKLNQLLREADCEEVPQGQIEESVKDVQEARKKQLEAREYAGSPFEKILSLIDWGRIADLKGDYEGLTDDINQQIVTLPAWGNEFHPTVKEAYFETPKTDMDDRGKKLRKEIKKKTKKILDEAKDQRSDPQSFLKEDDDEAEAEFKTIDFDDDVEAHSVIDALTDDDGEIINEASSAEALLEKLAADSVDPLLSELLVVPFENKKEGLEKGLEHIRDRKDQYRQLESIVDDDGASYASAMEKVDSIDSIVAYSGDEWEGNFRVDAVPKDRGRLTGEDLSENEELYKNDAERAQLVNTYLKPNFEGPKDPNLPIDQLRISGNDAVQTQYEHFRSGVAFMSPLFDEFAEGDNDLTKEVSNELIEPARFKAGNPTQTAENQQFVARGAFADDWDFAVTSFVTGIFLDNLSIFTEDCREAYKSVTDVTPTDMRSNPLNSVPDVVKSHSYGLDGTTFDVGGEDEASDSVVTDPFIPDESDGGFCYRWDVLNFETNGTKKLLDHAKDQEANERAVVEMLLEEHYEHVGYPTTIDPE